jgi:hypothetical protein
MRILQSLQNYLTHQLSKTSNSDGRLLLLAILIMYFTPILITSFSPKYTDLWRSHWTFPLVAKMPQIPLPFGDMRVITAGAECIRLGYDVLIENPCDPWKRPMNYPRIWSVLASWGLDQSHTAILGILCGLLFFTLTLITINRLNYIEALFYVLIVCSPSIMLAVERGNNDLIIFTLLALSLLIMKSRSLSWRSFSYIIILFASILKLYPIFSLTSAYKEEPKNFASIFMGILTAFGIYVTLNFESLKLVRKATTTTQDRAYGGMIIFDNLFKGLDILLQKYFHTNILNSINEAKLVIFILSVFIILLIAFLLAKTSNALYENTTALIVDHIDAFRTGSSIYLGTFLIGYNGDYRLIFLVFTIPQILLWLKNRSCLAPISALGLTGITLTLWLSRGDTRLYHLDELVNWLLFLFFAYTFALSSPKWLKSYIFSTSGFESRQSVR